MGGPRICDPRLAEAVVAIWCAEQGAMCVFVGGQAFGFCEPGMSVIGFGDPGLAVQVSVNDHLPVSCEPGMSAIGFCEPGMSVIGFGDPGYQSVSVSCESGLVICNPGVLATCGELVSVSFSQSGLVI